MPCRVKIASAASAANSRPSSESPAWKITGLPCGLRGTLNWPQMSKNRSVRANRPASVRFRNTPAPGPSARSPSCQESSSPSVAARNALARAYRSETARKPPRRKFSPVNASQEVTTFHAARPADRWSRVANCRATSYGSLKVELIVPASPSRSVTAASAASTVNVSGRPTTSRS